jgi:hypothetical protein
VRVSNVLKLLGAVVLTANAAGAASIEQKKDFQLFKDVAASVDRYTQFTIFDDVSADVKDGIVTLSGKVTMPYKRDDHREARRGGRRADGTRQITVLPVRSSTSAALQDRAIDLREPSFWNYASCRTRRSTSSSKTGGDADGRREQRSRSDAGAIARVTVRCALGDQRAEDRRGNARGA